MKKPSVSFYPDNFLGATDLWEHDQVGAYMRILCRQILIGHLSEIQILKIVGNEVYWEFLKSKFEKDENGLFFNERMESEICKARGFSASQTRKALKRHKNDKKPASSAGAVAGAVARGTAGGHAHLKMKIEDENLSLSGVKKKEEDLPFKTPPKPPFFNQRIME